MTTPRIAAAAILKPNDVVVSLPPPARHADIIAEICRTDGRYDFQSEQGFLLDDGTFVRRAPAFIIAERAGQLKEVVLGHRKLYSEDVW